MFLQFEGSPEECIKQLKEFIVRCGFEFSTETTKQEKIRVVMPDHPNVQFNEVPKSGEWNDLKVHEPEKSSQCKYCKQEFSKPRRHEWACHLNPNRPARIHGNSKVRRENVVKDYIQGKYENEKMGV